jgi:hypothetical protein
VVGSADGTETRDAHQALRDEGSFRGEFENFGRIAEREARDRR